MESASSVRGYVGGGGGGANVMQALVRNESSNDMSLVAMLASCSPVALSKVHQRTGGGLDDACGQKRAFYPTFEASGEDPAGEEDVGDDCTQHSEKKRRLSFDQVRSLEKNFEVENKLEPERKMQLARELGLQPRQVAVWFQNRRARWKTKQLERDYEVLTTDYNRLKADYDAVLQEKQDLQVEVDCLTGNSRTVKQNPLSEKSGIKRVTHKTEPAQVSSLQKTSEASVKLESVVPTSEMMNAASLSDELAARKEEELEEGSRATLSSDSISSEILNSDSPRTMDSGPLLVPQENISTFPHISGAGMVDVDSNILPLSDNLCDQILSSLDCQRVSVKPEDGLYQDDNCSFMLPQLDEEKGLPWWDWP